MAKKSERPNVLIIYCDELRTDALSCYGNREIPVHTPHIDSVARSGAQFMHCYCNSPICVPSRVSFLTGLYPEDTGVYCNEAAWKDFKLPRPLKTFPEVFAGNGYTTANFGKTHTPREMDVWQHNDERGGGMRELAEGVPGAPMDKLGWPQAVGAYPADKPYPPQRVTDNALEWLEQADGPWLVRMSYLQPHTPVYPPAEFADMFMDCDFKDTPPEKMRLSYFERRWMELHRERDYGLETLRRMRMHYYALVAWLDSQVGRIIEWLWERRQLSETIIVFTSDHGVSAGDRGCTGKHIFAPYVHRVPLMISAPQKIKGLQVRRDLCESVDIARTLFSLADIKPGRKDKFKGRDLFNSSRPEGVFSTIGYGHHGALAAPNVKFGDYPDGGGWPRRVCVRNDLYRLDKNVRRDGERVPPEEEDIFLSDYTSDIREIKNIAHKPEMRQVVEMLSDMIDEHIADSVEPF